MVAFPLAAQTPVQQVAAANPTTQTQAAAPVADTAVTWVLVGSNNGALRGKLRQLLKAEIAKAQAQGRTPFLEFGATWCGPCQALEARLHNKDMINAFSGAYIIHIDANEWDMDDELIPLGFKGGVMPILMAIDKTAKVTSQLNGAGDPDGIRKYIQTHPWNAQTQTDHSKLATR